MKIIKKVVSIFVLFYISILLIGCKNNDNLYIENNSEQSLQKMLSNDKKNDDISNEYSEIKESEPPELSYRNSIKEKAMEGMTEEERTYVITTMAKLNISKENDYIYDSKFSHWQFDENKSDNFIKIVENIKNTFKTDILDSDFDDIIYYQKIANDTQDKNYIIKLYYKLHDLDYYLLRDGRTEFQELAETSVYKYDLSTIYKYYGVLNVYK